MDTEVYRCSSCGTCCRRIGISIVNARKKQTEGNIDPFVAAIAAFPHSFNGSGQCEHLTGEMKCAIYDTRPYICNMEKGWDLFFKHRGKYRDLEHFYHDNALACNKMITVDGLDEKYLIPLESLDGR